MLLEVSIRDHVSSLLNSQKTEKLTYRMILKKNSIEKARESLFLSAVSLSSRESASRGIKCRGMHDQRNLMPIVAKCLPIMTAMFEKQDR